MKSIEYPITINSDQVQKPTKPINRKTIYYILLVASGIGGFAIPFLFIAFFILIAIGSSLFCVNAYKEISSLDFSSDKYSITLEDIIEDLEG